MEDKVIEKIVAKSVEIGVVNTLSQLGLISEVVTESQARKKYGRRLIDEWRKKRWIVGYPTGNKKRGKVYYKRSELETASRMLDIKNTVPVSKIFSKQ